MEGHKVFTVGTQVKGKESEISVLRRVYCPHLKCTHTVSGLGRPAIDPLGSAGSKSRGQTHGQRERKKEADKTG